jgi:hypothetical protein
MKGIYKSLSNDDYHAEQSHISSSNYKDLMKNIERFHKQKILGIKEPQKQKNVFDEGNYAHSLILEPEKIPEEYAFWQTFRKSNTAGTKNWDSFKAANQGKIILSNPQVARVKSWVANYERLPTAVEILKGCDVEYSLFGDYQGIKSKVRADAINVEKGYIVDVKTSGFDTDQETFKMVIEQFGYHLSSALYLDMFSEHYGKPFDFYFLVLGKVDNQCQVFKLSTETLNKGRMLLQKAVNKYKECQETGVWKHVEKSRVQCVDNYEILEV